MQREDVEAELYGAARAVRAAQPQAVVSVDLATLTLVARLDTWKGLDAAVSLVYISRCVARYRVACSYLAPVTARCIFVATEEALRRLAI